ncbi:TIGR02449 family protein [endosymbiont of Ridgeia piscesae]|uniref:Cell division protein ZapB n=2 Tax=endosymbiont of Ridgeia piscesae TaxID=54398 RepID=A0A0T5Z2S3_9GAMM|nr:TIGR02449 family protein [endosymbiont of Ridgeia piscesae]KRT57218.1 cell division protein ZapB [endosymbiont of Ridgeia piscesae]
MSAGRLTLKGGHSILVCMSQNDSIDNAEVDLEKLESQVDELIRACTHLSNENKSLRARQESLVAERAALIEKTELARNRVEAMITRLKSMESAQ